MAFETDLLSRGKAGNGGRSGIAGRRLLLLASTRLPWALAATALLASAAAVLTLTIPATAQVGLPGQPGVSGNYAAGGAGGDSGDGGTGGAGGAGNVAGNGGDGATGLNGGGSGGGGGGIPISGSGGAPAGGAGAGGNAGEFAAGGGSGSGGGAGWGGGGGGGGGGRGAAIVLPGDDTFSGGATGGAGGRGGDGGTDADGGGGGGGGDGLVVSGTGSLYINSNVAGGDGGNGGNATGGESYSGGGGGRGGDGLQSSGATVTVELGFANEMRGGDGGIAGLNTDGALGPAPSGVGGNGMTLDSSSAIVNGTVTGGNGGAGASPMGVVASGGDGAAGGSGITAVGSTILVSGSVTGGAGGAGGIPFGFGPIGAAGAGGAGIAGSDLTITVEDGATVAGGEGDGGRANAFSFSSGANIVTFEDGAAVEGGFAVASGTLEFDQTDDFVLDGDISGGGSLSKTGTGALTLDGTVDIGGSVTVADGKLALSGDNTIEGGITVGGGGPGTNAALSLLSDGAAGGASGRITTLGSVIDYGDGVTIATPIDIDSNTTQLQVATGAAEQSGVVGELNGPRPLEKIGAGTLTLSASNNYTGPTTVTGGTLAVTGSLDSTNVQIGSGAIFRVNNADDGTADAGALTDAAGVTVAVGGTFDVAADETLDSVTSAGTLDLNDNALTALGDVTVSDGSVTADPTGGTIDTPLFTQTGGTVGETVTVTGDAYVMSGGTLDGAVDSTAFSRTAGTLGATAQINSDYRVTAIGGTIAANGPGGIDAENDLGGIVIVTTADGDIDNDLPVGTGAGIRAATSGVDHDVSITLAGTVRGDTGGIAVSTDTAQSTSGVTIDFADDVTGENGHGIAVTSGGAIAVHNTGGSGVTVQGGGAGNGGIVLNTTLADGLGIHLHGSSGTIVGPADGTVETTGGADILIENWDRIEGQAGDGIRSTSNGGDIDIEDVLAIRGSGGDGIDAVSSGGDITVTGSGTGYTDNNGTPGNPFDDTSYSGIVGTGGDGVHADASNAGAGGSITIGGAGALANGGITGSQDGVEATTDGAGTVTVTAGGAITGQSGSGVIVRTQTGAAIVGGDGNVSGVDFGIDARSDGGNVTVTGAGETSASGMGGIAINAQIADAAATADVLVDRDGDVTSTGTGATAGINATNNGTLDSDVTVTGAGSVTVAGTHSTAIAARILTATSTGDIVIDRSGAIISTGDGTSYGVFAQNNGSGSIDIDTGPVTLADASLGAAINATSGGGGNIFVDNGGALNGGAFGINAVTNGAGAITVTTGGAIGTTDAVSNTGIATSGVNGQNQVNVNHSIGADITGVLAQNSGTGLVDINQATGTTITAGTTGIYALQSATGAGGDIDIDTAGTIDAGVRGVFATVGGGTTSGGIAIDLLSGADINATTAIDASIANASNASAIAITARTGSTLDGGTSAIRANTEGTGAVDILIQSGVTVDQTSGNAIIASADEGYVRVTANSAISSLNGYAVDASTELGVVTSGDVTVNGSGTLSSTNGPGAIRAVSDTGAVSVGGTGQTTSGGPNSTAIEARIASAFGTGNVVVNRSGAINSTGLGVSNGIVVQNYGTGEIDVDSGPVTLADASTGTAVIAEASGGNVFVDNAGALNGGATGIAASTSGAGNVTVTTGAVIGASDAVSGTGIDAETAQGEVEINLGHAVTTGGTGVRGATTSGTVDINHAAGLIISGGIGIEAVATAGQIDIDLTGAAAIDSAGTGIRVEGGTATVDIGANATVDGAVHALVASSPSATFNNAGTLLSAGNVLRAESGFARLNNLSGGEAMGNLSSILGAESFVDNRVGATFTLNDGQTSTLAGTDRIDNAGLFRATGSTVNGLEAFNNSAGGVLRVNEAGLAASTVTFGGLGLFSNAGTIDLSNVQAGGPLVADTLVLDGGYRGEAGSQIAVDIDLGPNNPGGVPQLSDKVVITGAFTGTSNVAFTVIDPTDLGLQDSPIIVVDLATAQPGVFTATGLPALGGIVEYQFGQVGEDWGVTSTVNLSAAGGVAANVTLAQSIISIMANRPSSPYVSGLAGIDDYHAGPAFWMRGVGGAARTKTSVVDSLGFESEAEVDLTYAGAQLGADLGWFNMDSADLTVNAGFTAGYNTGRTAQDVVSSFSNRVTSRTEGDFDSRYASGYVTVAKDRFFADLQARFDRTDFTFNNNNPLLGLNDADVSSDRFSINGGIGYAAELGERLTFIPSIGFSYARTKTTGVTFDNGSTLDPQDYETILGFGGATLVKTFILPDQVSAVSPFVTGTLYHDFGEDPVSIFTLGPVSRDITNQNLGTFGELSVGADYLRIFGDGSAGGPLKQLNANLRADFKFSDRVLAAGVNAQLRLQY